MWMRVLNKRVKSYYNDLQPTKQFQTAHETVLVNIHEVMTRKLVRAPLPKPILFPTKLK